MVRLAQTVCGYLCLDAAVRGSSGKMFDVQRMVQARLEGRPLPAPASSPPSAAIKTRLDSPPIPQASQNETKEPADQKEKKRKQQPKEEPNPESSKTDQEKAAQAQLAKSKAQKSKTKTEEVKISTEPEKPIPKAKATPTPKAGKKPDAQKASHEMQTQEKQNAKADKGTPESWTNSFGWKAGLKWFAPNSVSVAGEEVCAASSRSILFIHQAGRQ